MKRASKARKKHLPDLEKLHTRHRGLTPAVCGSFAEAARVCLSRHHKSPTEMMVTAQRPEQSCRLKWRPVGDRERAAWANADDATRDGAYSVAIAAVESELNLFAVARAETRTGADYYVTPRRRIRHLEDAYRLEVSGIDRGDGSAIATRLRQKVQQARNGLSDRPAIACVIGFLARKADLAKVEDGHAE